MIRYAGGKSKLRSVITPILIHALRDDPSLTEYREPFFGGGSIGLSLLSVPVVQSIWLNDKDIGVACMWTSILNYIPEFQAGISNTIPSVELYHQLKTELLQLTVMPTTPIEIVRVGVAKLVLHQISYSGLGTKSGSPQGGQAQASEYKIDCRWSPKYINKEAAEVNRQLSAFDVQCSVCTNTDFEHVVADTGCTSLLYLDPPYYVKGNELYQHGFTEQDHVRLSTMIQSTKHTWLLSYDDCPEIRALYSWAQMKSVDVKYSITGLKTMSSVPRTSTVKPELLIAHPSVKL